MQEIQIKGLNIYGQTYKIHLLAHKQDEQGRIFTLCRRLQVWYDEKDRLCVPNKYRSDGASIPRLLWPLLPTSDYRALRAGIVHDYLYEYHLEGWDRKKADDMFYRLLVRDGVNHTIARLCWIGVRLFGKVFWEKHNK